MDSIPSLHPAVRLIFFLKEMFRLPVLLYTFDLPSRDVTSSTVLKTVHDEAKWKPYASSAPAQILQSVGSNAL